MTPEGWIGLSLALPALCALGVLTLGRRFGANVRDGWTVVLTLATFASVVPLVGPVTQGERPGLELLEVLPGVPLAFEVEPLGMLFALLASGLWIVTSIYAFGYMRGHGETSQTRFFIFFALAITGALGVAYARNLFTLFLFYEMLTFSTYPLVTHHGTEKAKRAGRVYLGVLVTTSVGLLLLGILWTWNLVGHVEFQPGGILAGAAPAWTLPILLALFAFGTGKAALMPFHRWLPNAMVAPTPVSALLHAVAVVKAGVFTILKIVVYVFGIEVLAEGASEWLVWVASFTLLSASILALRQDNLKARLAYSTISQLAYIVVGAALASASGVLGGASHIAMHAAGKITLFFCAGAILVAAHKTEVSQLDGLGRRMPLTFGAFAIGSLCIIGVPPLGGAWSKWYLLSGSLEAGQPWLLAVFGLSTLLSVAYLLPIVGRGFFAGEAGADERIQEAPIACLIAIVATALLSIGLFFGIEPLEQLLRGIAL